MKKTGIITVTFNGPKLLEYQLKTLKKYCLDDYEFIVIDNSNNENYINEIKNICEENNISYIHKGFSVSVGNVPSTNHGLALNYAYETFKNKFDY
jgi:glycosyltransferase involved in cell wall biosynthesis